MTSDSSERVSYYRLNDSVVPIFLGVGDVANKSTLSEIIKRARLMRRKLVELSPDVVVAFMHSSYVPAGFALFGTGIPVVASEHIGTEYYQRRPLQRMLLYCTPFLAKNITVVSEQIRQSFPNWLRRKMVVAPNPVTISAALQASAGIKKSVKSEKILLSVGRLVAQKNQSCLLKAFSIIAEEFPDWRLRIIGEGELRSELEAQVKRLRLDRQVELPGTVRNIALEYQSADLFVLPSNYESFGLATAEALLHRLPVVGFADCPGTNVLVINNVNGLLVDAIARRTEALAGALRTLMAAPDELARLSMGPIQQLEKAFGLEAVLDTWEDIIQQST